MTNLSIHEDTRAIFQQEVRPQRLTAEEIGLDKISQIVDMFYERVRKDSVLGPRFSVVSDWSIHKASLAHFWWVALGGSAYAPFRYRVVEAHRVIDIQSEEITYWLNLFDSCLRASLSEPLAEAWMRRAGAMGKSLSRMVAGG